MEKRSTFNVLFLIRKNRLLKNGEAPVYMRITSMGAGIEISLNRSIPPDNWSSEKGGAIGNAKEAKLLNYYLESIRVQIHQIVNNLKCDNEPITLQRIKQEYLGIEIEEDKGCMLIELIEEHNSNMEKLVNIDYAYETMKRYRTSLSHVKAFIKKKYKKDDLYLIELDHKFITEYEIYFKTVRKCNHNTTMKYIKNLRKIINIAVSNGYLDRDPFVKYKMTYKKTDRGFLTEDDLKLLINTEFKIKRLDEIRDCFLFSCFTGLAHVDLCRLTKKNIEIDSKGLKWIKINRQKTSIVSSIPVLDLTQQIIDKYQNDKYCIENNILLPVKSNQKMNAYLKEIGDICGIQKHLTSHLARHTFATTVTLNNDVPIETISKMLGHTSIKTTNIYARLLDKKIMNDMKHLNDIYKDKFYE